MLSCGQNKTKPSGTANINHASVSDVPRNRDIATGLEEMKSERSNFLFRLPKNHFGLEHTDPKDFRSNSIKILMISYVTASFAVQGLVSQNPLLKATVIP